MKNNIEKIITYIVVTLMISIPISKLVFNILLNYRIVNEYFVLTQATLLWVFIPILIITYIIGLSKKLIVFNYYDIIIYLLIFTAIVATVFSDYKEISVSGEVFRNEGLLSILNYYLLFLNCRIIKNKKIIINTFIGVGLLQLGYGFLQIYTNFDFVKNFSIPYMASGLCGNPNFFGSFMVITSLITFTLYFFNGKVKDLILTCLFFSGILMSNSTAPFLGFVLALLFVCFYYRKKIKIKKLILLLLLLISVFIIHDRLERTNYPVVNPNYIIKEDIKNIIKDKKNIGNGRLEIWKNSIPLVKKYWLVGSGLDTFVKVYEQENNIIHDKAHNIYLQMLITNGFFSLFLYLNLLLIIFIKCLKFKDPLVISLFIAFIGYSIQGFANISVINVAPYFFIIMGLLNEEKMTS